MEFFFAPVELPCGHGLCRACALMALEIKRECPVCRDRPPGRLGDPVEPYLIRSTRLEEVVAFLQPVTCPNEGCEIITIQKDMAAHIEACPLSVAPCPMAKHGCAFSGNNAARDTHVASGECHFMPLKEFFQRYEKLDKLVRYLEYCSRKQQNEIDELKGENRAMKEEFFGL